MNTEMALPPAQLADSLRTVLVQGERAMGELGWTMYNVNWREALDALRSKAEQNDEHCALCYEAAQREGERRASSQYCPHGVLVGLECPYCD